MDLDIADAVAVRRKLEHERPLLAAMGLREGIVPTLLPCYPCPRCGGKIRTRLMWSTCFHCRSWWRFVCQ
jgi:hypothetical protein